MEQLRHLTTESNFNVTQEEDTPALFPDGGQAFICTDWATYVRRILGNRAKMVGFQNVEGGEEIGRTHAPDLPACGHDFALVDDRFIVDGWIVNVECFHDTGVLDIMDPANAEFIARYYGNPEHWVRNEDLERITDNEPPHLRAQAMEGVKPCEALLS